MSPLPLVLPYGSTSTEAKEADVTNGHQCKAKEADVTNGHQCKAKEADVTSGHQCKPKRAIQAIALALLLVAVTGVSALSAHETQGQITDSDGGWTALTRFTGEPFSPDTDGDFGVGRSPQELPPSTSGDEAPENDWALIGLAVVIAFAGALVLARRAR
jgi:hypothetical protein